MNDKECRVKFFLDSDFQKEESLLGVHPNDNTATVWLKVTDLIHMIEQHGNTVNVIQI